MSNETRHVPLHALCARFVELRQAFQGVHMRCHRCFPLNLCSPAAQPVLMQEQRKTATAMHQALTAMTLIGISSLDPAIQMHSPGEKGEGNRRKSCLARQWRQLVLFLPLQMQQSGRGCDIRSRRCPIVPKPLLLRSGLVLHLQ